MHRLLEQSQKTKKQADKILKKSGILEILKDYGEIKIGGSYALNTMLRADIDVFVVTEKHDWKKVLEIQRKIMETKYWSEFDFLNRVDFKTETSMTGYYFQPWTPIDNVLWKMDIWLITPDQDKSADLTDRFKQLLDEDPNSDEKRITILEIKEAMRKGKKYQKGVDGKLIYQAVLEKEISGIEEFKKFILK
jgi:hypothetical protein